MTPAQRDELEGSIEACSRATAELFERNSVAHLVRRPAEKSWSAAECVVHLNLTAAAAVPLVEAAVVELRSWGLGSSSPSRMDWIGWMLRWSLAPPARFRTKTTPAFQPLHVEPLSEVLPAFMRQQARIVEALRAAEGLSLSDRKITSPFNSRVRYNVYSMFCILETHERRHLWQAERAVSRAR